MSNVFSRCAGRYGQPVTLYSASGEALAQGKGFLQPVLSESKDYFWRDHSQLGLWNAERFLLLCPAELIRDEAQVELVESLGRRYHLRALQPYYVGSRLLYWWGVLTLREEEEDCP